MAEKDDCGCGGGGRENDKTRREFLQSVAVAGVGVTAALMMGTASTPAMAYDQLDTFAEGRDACFRNNCGGLTGWHEQLCRARCQGEYLVCKAGQALGRLNDALQEGVDWLKDHPDLVNGTLLFFLGVGLIFLIGPAGGLLIFA